MAGNRYDSALAKGFPENEREELSETNSVGRLLEDMPEEGRRRRRGGGGGGGECPSS